MTGLPKLSKLIMGTQIGLTARWERKNKCQKTYLPGHSLKRPGRGQAPPLPYTASLFLALATSPRLLVEPVKDAGLYMLWVEDLENKDVSVIIRYEDVVAAFEQPGI